MHRTALSFKPARNFLPERSTLSGDSFRLWQFNQTAPCRIQFYEAAKIPQELLCCTCCFTALLPPGRWCQFFPANCLITHPIKREKKNQWEECQQFIFVLFSANICRWKSEKNSQWILFIVINSNPKLSFLLPPLHELSSEACKSLTSPHVWYLRPFAA